MARRSLLVAACICCIAIGIVRAKLYTSTQNNTYFIEARHKYNWFQSQNQCTLQNMTLLSIENADKNREIHDLINENFKDKEKPLLYIGANDLANLKHFCWTKTGLEFDYTNWSEGEPNNYGGNEHCVHIGLYDDDTWNDVDCSMRFGYICEENKK
ncbi:lectin subunit alpha-like [Musca domestica]|uniref:Lectin subunit alpha n=1 Tax=Musca domestica TaxID=7370 RepID=A0A9J7I4F8_MUSDO|nr:lectin subunit alpha [Musca domestica]XP_058978241.1 lectin subunit alpha-like [Musca domestica]